MKTKRDLINTITVNRANLEHIAKTGNINGTLLMEIERVMEEYANLWNVMTKEEPEYYGKYLTKNDVGDIEVLWYSNKHGKNQWYANSECDIEFLRENITEYKQIE